MSTAELNAARNADRETSTDPEVAAAAELAKQQERGRVEFDADGQIQSYDLDGLQRVAKMYASSDMVPEHYRGNIANCAVAIQMAMRCKVDILAFLQNSYIVHGKPGIESKLAIGLLHASGCIRGRIKYKFDGEAAQYGCTASVVDTASGDIVEGPKVDHAMIRAEKWDKDGKTKSGATITSKWKTMGELMFRYRAAIFLIRTTYPEVMLGLQTIEELRDVHGDKVQESSSNEAPASDIRSKLDAIKVPDDLPPYATNGIDAFAECETPLDVHTTRRELLEDLPSDAEAIRKAADERLEELAQQKAENPAAMDEPPG